MCVYKYSFLYMMCTHILLYIIFIYICVSCLVLPSLHLTHSDIFYSILKILYLKKKVLGKTHLIDFTTYKSVMTCCWQPLHCGSSSRMFFLVLMPLHSAGESQLGFWAGWCWEQQQSSYCFRIPLTPEIELRRSNSPELRISLLVLRYLGQVEWLWFYSIHDEKKGNKQVDKKRMKDNLLLC